MAFDSYSSLKRSIYSWLHRSDLDDVIPDLVTLAEVDFNRNLRINAMETSVTGTVTADSIPIPSDLIDLKRLFLTVAGSEIDLLYASNQQVGLFAGSSSIPQFYTEQGNQYVLGPEPDGQYSYTMLYYKKIDALSDSVTTNWLLQNAPDLYLFGALLKAAPFINDDERIATWQAFYERAKDEIQKMDDEKSLSSSGLQVRSDVLI